MGKGVKKGGASPQLHDGEVGMRGSRESDWNGSFRRIYTKAVYHWNTPTFHQNCSLMEFKVFYQNTMNDCHNYYAYKKYVHLYVVIHNIGKYLLYLYLVHISR